MPTSPRSELCTSETSRRSATLADLVDGLDPRAGVRGRQFEQLCRWYLTNAPEYKAQLARVWAWDDWPGRWGPDAGIDLVAETHGGDLWAVQAKCYSSEYSIKKSDVDSFLSESNRADFAFRLLIATTDRIGHTARRTLVGQEKPASLLLLSQLTEATIRWPESIDALRPAEPEVLVSLPHQEEAIQSACRGLSSGGRGQVIMPCGSGKTLVAIRIAEELGSRRVLVLVPSLSLLAQTIRQWTANARQEFRMLAVCSDATVADEDGFVAQATELGFPVTTAPAAIASFLDSLSGNRGVVFSTYQSSGRVAEAQDMIGSTFDLAVADEAHRCAGPIAGDFAVVLDAEKLRADRRLFMTATPRYFTGRLKREARQADIEIASMDDPEAFGPVLHYLSFGHAISRGLLSDYQVVVVGVSDAESKRLVDTRALVSADGVSAIDAQSLASQIGVVKTIRKYDLRRVISFHGRVKRARAFSTSLPAIVEWLPPDERPSGTLWARHVSGEMSSGERDRHLHQFRDLGEDQRGLLSNARCLGEGVDVPSIDGIAFIDPRGSQIDIIQAVGRAIRKSPNKKIGTIVLPVVVDEHEDPQESLSSSPFKPIWEVLRALRAHDELLAEELDELRRSMGRGTFSGGHPSKIKLDFAAHVDESFVRAFDARLVEQTSEGWEFWFGLLQQYTEREGHSRVLQDHFEGRHGLGAWVGRQRTLFRAGLLDPRLVAALEGLDGWTWDVFTTRWDEGLARLTSYAAAVGHARVPKDYRAEGFPLGQWTAVQRRFAKSGDLSEARRRSLEALPGWVWDLDEAAWEAGFVSLVGYVSRVGNARVPQDYVEDGFRLGGWVGFQRLGFRQHFLDEARVDRLAALPGWEWHVIDAKWESGFERLQRYVASHGKARVSSGHVVDGLRLDTWVVAQRQAFKRGTLAPDRAERLASLPGWAWDAREADWEDGLVPLAKFVSREGHARVPVEHVEDDFALGHWVLHRRQQLRRGTLGEEQVSFLNGLPGWAWNTKELDWQLAFERLKSYTEQNGSALMRKDHVEDGFSLGGWLHAQRQLYSVGKISDDHKRRLEELPGWVWNSRLAAWEEAFSLLSRFTEREGHARVPVAHRDGDFALGEWVHQQRQAQRRGKLDPERAQRFEALPGWSWQGRPTPSSSL